MLIYLQLFLPIFLKLVGGWAAPTAVAVECAKGFVLLLEKWRGIYRNFYLIPKFTLAFSESLSYNRTKGYVWMVRGVVAGLYKK